MHISTFVCEYNSLRSEESRASRHLDGVVTQTTDDSLVVVLQTVHALAGLAVTHDLFQIMTSCPPVVLNTLYTHTPDGVIF